eukprot:CAMPEP_0206816420 /NCGR_PEP_ID=MMETSP0975-20121206/9784_1 /ASSEMBLY_ACC=CAM_ASM_000399 /TAXON_ID=483370 /ORGANISM="non described non described, Strain CCMP2097" /LENGTH=131 /DNA_ID=CAMNT_0054358613 /DNA_START=505 /DNA_END=900 /DNA_ORIENTATION=-
MSSCAAGLPPNASSNFAAAATSAAESSSFEFVTRETSRREGDRGSTGGPSAVVKVGVAAGGGDHPKDKGKAGVEGEGESDGGDGGGVCRAALRKAFECCLLFAAFAARAMAAPRPRCISPSARSRSRAAPK